MLNLPFILSFGIGIYVANNRALLTCEWIRKHFIMYFECSNTASGAFCRQSESKINSGSFLSDFKLNVASLIFSVVIRSTSLSELESRELFTWEYIFAISSLSSMELYMRS